jgi:hypothetical protein
MGAQQEGSSASPKRVWVVVGASRGIGEEYVAQVRGLPHWAPVPPSRYAPMANAQLLCHILLSLRTRNIPASLSVSS